MYEQEIQLATAILPMNHATGRHTQGILLTSSDHGARWEEKERFPFGHARLFRDGHNL